LQLPTCKAVSQRTVGRGSLPNRWPTQRWAREVADKELAIELGGYMHRLMSPVPEINGYVSLLKDIGAAPRINPPCRQLALRMLERMGLSLYSFIAQKHWNVRVMIRVASPVNSG
jgi:hypothetical protein